MKRISLRHNPMTAARTLLATAFILTAAPLSAGINIGGNVYGGGNEGEVNDGTHVTVRGGSISGNVFGGGRMADVEGGTRVTLDGANATSDIFISKVFGGNDISGTVTGTASGDALVESTYSAASGDAHRIWVDELYGGGNGDYNYASNIVDGVETNPYYGKSAPEIENTSISLLSGCYGKVFGGGNKATVTESTTIFLNNSTATLLDRAGESLDYQFGSVFGGNNLVAMSIRPTWQLQKGSIDNLYSGGNKGDMTHENGILLAVTSQDMTVNNMFGGCRMANVNPAKNDIAEETFTIGGTTYTFPEDYAARVLVTAGRITNVYGGNDVSGNVYGGNALEIRSSIIGDIYGGGNGSYAYSDIASGDADYWYDVPSGQTSAQALYSHRPNAESANIHISGTEAQPTYVGGSLYCGGNSATLAKDGGSATVNLKIGSYVIAKNVFLGSNGANMVTEDILKRYADDSFSSLDLTYSDTFEEYMRGCEVSIKPTVTFDTDYTEYSTKFESMYCGGNVGSMSADGYFDLDFLQSLVIYQKLVGGCNNANVAESTYNAAHEGGLTAPNTTKVILNIDGMKFEPKTITYNPATNAFDLADSYGTDGLLKGGNVYGGCYESGYINGGVEINIKKDAISTAVDDDLEELRDDVFNTALSAFGGGYGERTEIRGNTEINLTGNANIVKVFGGGEMGVVNGSTAINLLGGQAGAIYGGGFEGLVKGNSKVSLDGGSVHFAFAGACNADINGYAEMLIGANGTPTVTDELFGGNDFGGRILGAGLHDAYGTDKVKSNTYVLYKNGTVEGGIYGGSYGSYDYTATPYLTKAQQTGFSFPSFTTAVADDGTADIYSNSYVDIFTSNTSAVAGGNIYGGGYGYLNIKGTADIGTDGEQLPIVDMANTYVLLRSSNSETNVAPEILGGGYYSTVYNTRVDVRNGLTGNIYGGTYGATAATSATEHMDPAVNYRSTSTTVNVYSGTAKNMNVFGGGANAGSVETNVNLLGGTVNNVYGGSNMEGVVVTANVSVPESSTSVSKAIFGGGYGSDDSLPCDVITANVSWASNTAYVSDGVIYGGNNYKRATKVTNVDISAPVMTSATGTYASVCGGGNGENTITGYSHVNLLDGAQVKNVYGGGRDGKVYGYYDDKFKANAYYDEENHSRNVYAHWAYSEALADATWGTQNGTDAQPNTSITIGTGATAQNIYGAGWGEDATVSGNTYVQLAGGTVTEDIFGGGYSGNVYVQENGNLGTAVTPANMTGNLYTYVDIDAGCVRNVYGGGFNGNVGNATASAETRVGIGESGDPAILRSVYGGGYKGAVIGTAKTRMFGGHVGYYMDGASYAENLNYEGSTDNLLKENGNVFGGGFGEGATVDNTDVTLYDGTIRNSLYGGGEIAAIGRGTVNADKVSATITQAGSTLIHMYGGLVAGDVFGGGRGYAIDAYGNTTTGEIGYSDGYTFGNTAVYIHRGRIGTETTVAKGQGNVFGGGNIGYVYTATGEKSDTDGYYYNNGLLTEDCKVIVAPVCQVKAGESVTIGGETYSAGEYVPLEKLNTLAAAAPVWEQLDELGATIGNAVFAGGNVSAGSDKVYANAKTVFGNATASVTDVFNKDFISIGDDGIGGLYGDGNLTFVDGYRELNISNYGTDYYNLDSELTYEKYLELNDRERAYFELLYYNEEEVKYENFYQSKSVHQFDGVSYKTGQKITKAEYDGINDTEEKANWTYVDSKTYGKGTKLSETEWALFPEDWQKGWKLFGFCTLYAGRMINTIQRADFCGVFGSRICLRGAQDRVTNVADYTNYTINRVKEVSLNQVSDHGNYFGIYNVVNYLGALTSDVDFQTGVRVTGNTDAGYKDDNYSKETDEAGIGNPTGLWSGWKQEHLNDRKRNNGESKNQVALASGVWLEIVDESTENQEKGEDGTKPKIYGPITGVVELDLLNVATGEGGGYVYAKNVHGVRSGTANVQVTLSAANQGAVSMKQFQYDDAVAANRMQSSGNFVHSTKRIVDDCYPLNGAYYGENAAPAHYWYVRGEYYVYDQYISAYTGSAQAYAKTVSIPLTITAEAQGRLQLESVDDNYYAYWDGEPDAEYKSRTTDNAILVNGVTYVKNAPITYWEWNKLTTEEQAMFQKVTYVCSEDVAYGSTSYKAGDVILPSVYDDLPSTTYICTQDFISGTTPYVKGDEISASVYAGLGENQDNCKTVKAFFNITNAVSHDNGFLLTFDWDNPEVWDDYYHQEAGTGVTRKSALSDPSGYILSPTFRVDESGVYGQLNYSTGDLVEKAVYDAQANVTADLAANSIADTRTGQATFEEAYIARNNCEFTVGGEDYNYVKGAPVAASVWSTFGSYQSNFEPGYICTETYQMSESEMIINGETLTNTEYASLKTTYGLSDAVLAELQSKLSKVYICSAGGSWGGNVFVENHNYEAAKYGNLPRSERAKFHYNYDAFDMLSENFQAAGDNLVHYQGASGNNANNGTAVMTTQIPYAEKQSIDYTATYGGEEVIDAMQDILVTRNGTPATVQKIEKGDVLINTEYEKLTNEQACYTALLIPGKDAADKVYYVVNTPFQVSDTYYNTGKIISDDVYANLSEKDKVTRVTKGSLPGSGDIYYDATKTYYFCTKEYTAQTPINSISGLHEAYAVGATVPVGTIINEGDAQGEYGSLKNLQKGFSIDGKVPTATSTLYVARETDIRDLSQDKIVTVTYWYDYVESDESGTNYETIRERHIVNVHVHFESGVPAIGELLPPSTVLPGTKVGLNQPAVSKGAYEILGGGWEMYTNQADAQGHKNGVPYVNNNTKMYWYQDGYYVAYYAKSYLGKTYSNPVQFSVANYHKMGEVVSSKHKETTASGDAVEVNDYMYIDEAVKAGKRKPKIYIGTDDELNDFAAFFTLTTTSGDDVLENVADAANLEFFLHDDIAHDGEWTPIGTDDHCFEGTFHGDGHTISGLDHSLFGNLCNDVYNLGVTGSFTGGGIADSGTGYAENCWVATTGTPATGTMAIIGNPTRTENLIQIVNCYYPETNSAYSTADNTHGLATMKPVRSFLNGEVAYDLNGFYLTKRYHDAKTTSGNEYSYWTMNDGRTAKNPTVQTGHYSAGTNDYVENYYADGDFRYSEGIVPLTQNIRENNLKQFFPVWPDDYIFFGQTLSFDAAHDNGPAAVIKHVAEDEDDADMRLIDLENTGNRVFRAPAYYRSKVMDVAHFNSNAVFYATYAVPAGLYESEDRTYDAYKGMTAIDFTGYNDGTWAQGVNNGIFNRKVTDYIGLTGFKTNGITQNLLAYIPAADGVATSASTKTNTVLTAYFNEPALTIGSDYSNVAKVSDVSTVHGHVVQKNGSYVAHENHFLVDKQDFNAPIEYTFDEGLRMWYQREPSGFVKNTSGGAWETIVLPFTATLVSAHQKGELTHFYGDSSTGHEYWLRGFSGMDKDSDNKPVALFSRPEAGSTDYEYTNHFLWDTYYSEMYVASGDAGPDKNSDLYQTYYNKDITYEDYGFLTEGVPYIVAFPDSFFYEFDMSGKFVPHYTATGATFPTLDKQTVSYLSAEGAEIAVSDDMSLTTASGSYNFRGTFLNDRIATESYTLNAAGDAFEYKAVASGDAVPFRAHFNVTAASGAPQRGTRAQTILIGNREIDNIGDPDLMNGGKGLKITSDNMTIYIESSLGETVILNVTSAAGKLIKVVPVLPGTKVAVPVSNRGIYLVNRTKVAVVR